MPFGFRHDQTGPFGPRLNGERMKKISLSDALVYDQRRKLWSKAEKRRQVLNDVFAGIISAGAVLIFLLGIL